MQLNSTSMSRKFQLVQRSSSIICTSCHLRLHLLRNAPCPWQDRCFQSVGEVDAVTFAYTTDRHSNDSYSDAYLNQHNPLCFCVVSRTVLNQGSNHARRRNNDPPLVLWLVQLAEVILPLVYAVLSSFLFLKLRQRCERS